jgi:hypothetical protein
MTYYFFIQDNQINGCGQCKCLNDDILNVEVAEEVYNAYIEDNDRYIWDGVDVVINSEYEDIKRQKERQRLDALTLTPADVERALYKAKGMDFDDLKALITAQIPFIDIKALSIEFRAKDFYRGAEAGGMRLFDVVGQLLDYTSDDMDYLFTHKELPTGETP